MNTLRRVKNHHAPAKFVNELFWTSPFFSAFNMPEGNVAGPPVNIIETNNAYELDIAVPGYKKTDFQVTLTEDLLEITADIKKKEAQQQEQFSRREFAATGFKRSFKLPEGKIDINGITAEYIDGILKVTVPKLKEQGPHSRVIDIN